MLKEVPRIDFFPPDFLDLRVAAGLITKPEGKNHYDARHKKTDLRVFVGVIPKEGWSHVAAPILLLV